MRRILRACPVLLASALLASGCAAPEPQAVNVKGNILLDGQAMSDGDIYFQSGAGKPPVHAKIIGGSYTIHVPPGEYRVAIRQDRDKGMKTVYGDPQLESNVAARYNVETTLTASVTPDGPKEFHFEIESH